MTPPPRRTRKQIPTHPIDKLPLAQKRARDLRRTVEDLKDKRWLETSKDKVRSQDDRKRAMQSEELRRLEHEWAVARDEVTHLTFLIKFALAQAGYSEQAPDEEKW